MVTQFFFKFNLILFYMNSNNLFYKAFIDVSLWKKRFLLVFKLDENFILFKIKFKKWKTIFFKIKIGIWIDGRTEYFFLNLTFNIWYSRQQIKRSIYIQYQKWFWKQGWIDGRNKEFLFLSKTKISRKVFQFIFS